MKSGMLWVGATLVFALALLSPLHSSAEEPMDVGATSGRELALSLTAESVYLQPGPMIFRLEILNAVGLQSALLKDGLPCDLAQGPVRLKYTLARVEGDDRPISWFGAEGAPRVPFEVAPWSLAKSQGVSMLVDLTDVEFFTDDPHGVTPTELSPGRYRFAVEYPRSRGDRSNEVEFEVRSASGGDRGILTALAQPYWRKEKDMTWCSMIAGCRDAAVLGGLSEAMKRQALPYLLFAEVFHADRLGAVGRGKLDAMAGTMFEPESKAWRYELLQARGQHGEAAAVREEIETQHPGLLWLLDRIDRDKELRLGWVVGRMGAAGSQ